MRVLFVIDSLSGGGAEKLLVDIITHMSSDVECEVLALTRNGDRYSQRLEQFSIPIIYADANSHISRVLFIKKYIEGHNFDIVHANLFPCTYYCALAKKITAEFPKLVMTEHSTFNKRRKHKILHPIEKFIYELYDRVYSISNGTQNLLIEWIQPKDCKKYRVINNGIDIVQYENITGYSKSVFFDKIKENDYLLLMVGSFSPHKNHKMLIEAFKKLPDNYYLILAGTGMLENESKKLATNLGIGDRIKFLGYRDDIPVLMTSADLVIVPSLWEGFGLVAAEAMACGTLVVASNVPGVSEVVESKEKLFDPLDPTDIANRIMIATKDKNKIDKCQLRKTAMKYSINITVHKYYLEYVELLQRKYSDRIS